MAQITRPNIPQQPSRTRGLGPAPVQGQLAEAQAEKAFGQTIEGISNQYLDRSIKSLQDSQYNKAISQAQLEFNRMSSQRMQQQTDEKGNPTFSTLVSDVGNIGNTVRDAVSTQISDPEVLARFTADFNKTVSNRQLKAFDVSRQQHVSFTRASISENIQTTTQVALEDSPDVIEQYVAQVEDVIAQGVQSGALSPEEAQRLVRSSAETMRAGVISNQISANPQAVLGLLEQDASKLGISQRAKEALVTEANAAVRDQQRAEEAESAALEKRIKDNQNINTSELSIGIIKGSVGEADIEKAFNGQQISAENRQKLRAELARVEKAEGVKRKKTADIDASIANGSSLFGMTSGEINDHYISKVDSLSAEGPISLQEKAKLVKDYTVPVNAFAKELGFGITQGSLENAGAIISSYDFLIDNKSLTLSKLSDQEKSVIARASEISLNTDVGDREALNRAREEILNRTPDETARLSREFGAIEEFNPENIELTIQEMFDVDPFLTLGGTELSRDVVPAMRNLFRNAYATTGSVDAAMKRVKAETVALFGNSEVGRDEVFMLLPPEQVFKGVPSDVLKKDLQTKLKTFKLPEGVPVERTGINALLPDFLADTEVSSEDIFLESDTITRDNVQNPSWGLYFLREDGQKVYLQDPSTGEPVRWSFDVRDFQERQKAQQVFKGEELLEQREESFEVQEALEPARRR